MSYDGDYEKDMLEAQRDADFKKAEEEAKNPVPDTFGLVKATDGNWIQSVRPLLNRRVRSLLLRGKLTAKIDLKMGKSGNAWLVLFINDKLEMEYTVPKKIGEKIQGRVIVEMQECTLSDKKNMKARDIVIGVKYIMEGSIC